MLSDVMHTTGEISSLIKCAQKREKLLENLKEQIANSEKSPPIKPSNILSQIGQ